MRLKLKVIKIKSKSCKNSDDMAQVHLISTLQKSLLNKGISGITDESPKSPSNMYATLPFYQVHTSWIKDYHGAQSIILRKDTLSF
jgi:hypothetical protein